MKSILKYLKHYKKESVLGPFFKLLEASFELVVPLVMAFMIDVGIGNRDIPYILKCGGVLLLLGLIGMVSSVTAQYFAARAAAGFGTELRNDLFRHIHSLSYSEIDGIGTGTLITRMTSDSNQVQSCVNMVLRLFLRSPVIVVGAMIMAFTVNVKAAMVFVVVIPALLVVVMGIMVVTTPLYRKVQSGLDVVLMRVRENLMGVRVVRAFNRQEDERRQFGDAGNQLSRMQIFVGNISALMNPMTYVIINLGIIILIWTGGKETAAGAVTQGQVVALVNYMSQILVELIKLANLIVFITKALACGNRIESVLEEKSHIQDGQDSSPILFGGESVTGEIPAVEFRDVGFSYLHAKSESLESISFSVKRGETVGIIGGTGSGKTTLVNLIPRFYDVSRGEVLVAGRNVKEVKISSLREKIGVVPQKAVLFNGSIRENMQWGLEHAGDGQIMEALEIAQAAQFVKDKKGGLDAHITQGGKNLSGGQKQRLTIARALVKKPDILILDDSSSALDFATDARLRKALKELEAKTTVFIVSQRASAIMNADKIIVLEDGCVAGIGKHDDLLRDCGEYKEICLSQLSEQEVAASVS